MGRILQIGQATGLMLAVGCAFAGKGKPEPGDPRGLVGNDVALNDKLQSQSFMKKMTEALAKEPFNKGVWGVMIADAGTGRLLCEQNADKHFVPASNMKLYTTAMALEKLGPEFRFKTTLETEGPVSGGVMSGDLYLVGRGDPNLSPRQFPLGGAAAEGPAEKVLIELAEKVVEGGIKKIAGDIIGDDSYFVRNHYVDGWEVGDIPWGFAAPVSSLVVNDNSVFLRVAPGKTVGDTASAVWNPASGGLTCFNEIKTAEKDEKPEITLVREPGASSMKVWGKLPLGGLTQKLTLAMVDPAKTAAGMLHKLLLDRGVTIGGAVRSVQTGSSAPRRVIAEHVSLPLADTFPVVNKLSQNLHAEVLLRAAVRQCGPCTSPEELQKGQEEFFKQVGIVPGDVVQKDGSGLSRHNLATPRSLVALLLFAQKQAWFPFYFASLPVAGVDGTLKNRMKNLGGLGKISAKTGSMTHVQALAGYGETQNGRRLVFSFVVNNQIGKSQDIHGAMDSLCLAMLQAFDPGNFRLNRPSN